MDLVLLALTDCRSGSVYIPKLPSATVGDLAVAVAPGATWRTISSPAGVANFPGTFAWTPEAGGSVDDRTPGGAKTGIIRITPTTGNFPAVSRKFKVT